MTYDLIIIGAGAAGLFAASNSPADWKTLVLEKTSAPGQKLLLTGNGQCNLTNDEKISAFLTRYGKNGKLLRSVLFPYSNLALMSHFEYNALELTTRADGKVFPASMRSADVLNLLLALSKTRNIEFRYCTAVTRILHQSTTSGSRFLLETTDGKFFTEKVLVTVGGASYPQTGSDGTFLACLESLGLNIVAPRPALAPIFVQGYPYKELSGLSFDNCKIAIIPKDGRHIPACSTEGLLLTHKGFSGPAILTASRYVMQGDGLILSYLPTITTHDLRLSLLKDATGNPRQIVRLLESITGLPHRFLEHVCRRSNVEASEKASRLSGREMGLLAQHITTDSYEISGTGGFSIAMATAGGLNLNEVNLRTMESKRYQGLYFAGEVLDVDGDTGGYNLQFAFSSAMCSIKAMQSK